jgi:hypothetical protein
LLAHAASHEDSDTEEFGVLRENRFEIYIALAVAAVRVRFHSLDHKQTSMSSEHPVEKVGRSRDFDRFLTVADGDCGAMAKQFCERISVVHVRGVPLSFGNLDAEWKLNPKP